MKLSAIHFTLATVISAVAFTGFAQANSHDTSHTKAVKATASKDHVKEVQKDAPKAADLQGKTTKTETPVEQKISAAPVVAPATKEPAGTADTAKDSGKPAVMKTQTGQVGTLSPGGTQVRTLEKSAEKPAEKPAEKR